MFHFLRVIYTSLPPYLWALHVVASLITTLDHFMWLNPSLPSYLGGLHMAALFITTVPWSTSCGCTLHSSVWGSCSLDRACCLRRARGDLLPAQQCCQQCWSVVRPAVSPPPWQSTVAIARTRQASARRSGTPWQQSLRNTQIINAVKRFSIWHFHLKKKDKNFGVLKVFFVYRIQKFS